MASPQVENGYTKIANELFDALAASRIPGEQRQCLDVIIRKTYGFNKKWDYIALSQFYDATGINKPHIIRALKCLILKNLIIAKKGNKKGSSYCINKNYHSWNLLPKKVMIAKKGNPSLPKKVPTKDNTTKDNIYITPNLGEFENVKIKEDDLLKLKNKFSNDWTQKIEDLSQYIEKFPKKAAKYNSHYAVILSWNRMDEKRNKGKPSITQKNLKAINDSLQ